MCFVPVGIRMCAHVTIGKERHMHVCPCGYAHMCIFMVAAHPWVFISAVRGVLGGDDWEYLLVCVPTEPQGEGGLIAAGMDSSHRLPGSQGAE